MPTDKVTKIMSSDDKTPPVLTDEQMDDIAERAATRAVEKLTQDAYRAVGKSVVDKFLYILGVCALGLYFYLQQKGIIK